VSDIYGE